MKSSPTLSLCMIVKNEEKNLPRLLDSVEGCMDEIIIVDTGSTDKTVEIAIARGCKVEHFEWVDSFCEARNYAFSHATKDYIAWFDADDVLSDKENFIKWKETCMEFGDCFLNTYNYAMSPDGKPIIAFMRERVFKRSINPLWQYDIHEGVILKPEWKTDYAISWTVNHMRDADDLKADRSRNLNIIEKMKKTKPLDGRLQFYYGKELYESQRPQEALPEFDRALEMKLELHDKILTYQYASYASQLVGDSIKDELKEEKHRWYKRAIEYALDGIKHDPNRAEFFTTAADCCIKMQDLVRAMPLYAAAKYALTPQAMGSKYASAVYNFKECYGELPTLQLAKINLNIGRLPEAKAEALECFTKYQNKEAEQLVAQIDSVTSLVTLTGNEVDCDDIVISCPPNQAYPFDEEIYKTKPLGGSETALVQMARHLKEKTGRPVKVFNSREDDLVAESGVEYISNKKANEYFVNFKPHTHIAWRHNIRLSKAPTYLWGHDLFTPTTENVHNFDKFLCLSSFHKDFTIGRQGVPGEKIIITRNGIDLKKLAVERKEKNPNKIVWMSSPDRGLEKAMLVCDKIRETKPDIELHVYYGIENLYKYGPQMSSLADKLKSMMAERTYVKYHGFTEQKKMYQDVSDAVIWLHPCNFIETFCITALEMLALGVYPVTRKLGALANTLAEAESKGMATMLSHDAITDEEIRAYADATIGALDSKRWEDITLDMTRHDWGVVADEWVEMMGLLKTSEVLAIA